MSNRLVSIVIVSAGSGDYLGALLDSVSKQTCLPLETIIIDNSPRQEIKIPPLRGKVYSAGKNLFYCQALNKGIKMSKGEFILCLNDDVVLENNFLEEALKGFRISPRVGMVSAKVLRIGGKILDSSGLFLSIWFTAEERGYGSIDKDKFDREGCVFGVNGAVAFYRRSMLEDIKIGPDYFDEEYRIFYEDLDIAWRAQNFGWRGYFVPSAIAYHTRGGTVREGRGTAKPFARRYLSDELHLYLIKNRLFTIIKNASFIKIIFHLPFILLYDLAAFVYIIFSRPWMLKNIFPSLQQLKLALRKRKIIKNILQSRIKNKK